MTNQRVVITGIGVLSPNGVGKDNYWDNISCGISSVDNIKAFDTSKLKYHKGYEVNQIDSYNKDYNERTMLFLDKAFNMAINDAALNINKLSKNERVGIAIGTGMGESKALEEFIKSDFKEKANKINSSTFLRCSNDYILSQIASKYEIIGPSYMISTACSASNDAIGLSLSYLRNSRAKIMIAGGVEIMSEIAYIGFCRLGAFSPDICRPFDKNRSGTMGGEGSGIIIMETLESALERKANIYAEILGFGTSCDAYHITAQDPSENGGVVKALKNALKNANINIEDIDYISAHGTGTSTNDLVETNAIKNVFGDIAYDIPISSIKSMIGHTAGAAGVLGLISGILAMNKNFIPPTINYTEKDELCDLDYVPNVGRECNVKILMNNSFAFGGNNSVVVVKKFQTGVN